MELRGTVGGTSLSQLRELRFTFCVAMVNFGNFVNFIFLQFAWKGCLAIDSFA